VIRSAAFSLNGGELFQPEPAAPTAFEPKTIEKDNDGEDSEAVDVSKQKRGSD